MGVNDRICRDCGFEGDLKYFSQGKPRPLCNSCNNLKRRRRYAEITEEERRARTIRRRKESLRSRYGIEQDDYERLLEEQGGVCKICKSPPKGKGANAVLHVDHHHETRKVRGLLCWSCNQAIGIAGEEIALLQKAADYLRHHQSKF